MDKDSKDALKETRAVLCDLAMYLTAVDQRNETLAHPSISAFSRRISVIADEIDGVLEVQTVSERSA